MDQGYGSCSIMGYGSRYGSGGMDRVWVRGLDPYLVFWLVPIYIYNYTYYSKNQYIYIHTHIIVNINMNIYIYTHIYIYIYIYTYFYTYIYTIIYIYNYIYIYIYIYIYTIIYTYMWQGPFGIMRPSSFLIPFVSILVSLSVPNLSPYFSISIAILLSGRFRSKESPCLPFLASLSIAQCSSFWWLSG